ncbi:MAG: hypothetical protein JXA71_16255 [Chitinispirillaceae bacterium]|nr:hypothetical protein [Chitinispirillaceae bacterium]
MRAILGSIVFFALACSMAAPDAHAGTLSLSHAETLLLTQRYEAATTAVRDYLESHPGDIKALYLLVAIEQTEILDYESYTIRNARFMKLCDSVNTLLKQRLPLLHGNDSIRCLFYIANIHGGKGVLLAKTGNWLGGLKDALASVSMLKEVVRLDSTMHAAQLGVGIFHYYLSKSFKWLPFVDENSEKEGIKAITKATRAPYPFNFAAKNSLCWILIEQKKLARADSISKTVIREVPDNTIFLRLRSCITLWSGRHEEAVLCGEKLAKLSMKRKPVNWSDLVLAYSVIAQGNDRLGRKEQAKKAVSFICGAGIPREYASIPPVKKNLKHINTLKKKYGPKD